MTMFLANYWYRAEKPYGVGRTREERASYIVPGWRGEVISGLEDGRAIYTGVCASKAEASQELVSHLKAKGYTGVLRAA